MIERAKIAVNAKSDADLARYLGVSTPVVSGYRQRQTVPLEQCVKIAERTGVSLDWLILGKGEMKGGSGGAAEFDDADAVWVPLYDVEVSAGSGIEVYGERVIQRVPFAKSWLHSEGLHARNLACLPVHGDSMKPSLTSGDIVLVNHAKRGGDGVFVVRMGNALRVKRLQWLANGDLRISSDNPIYQTEQITPADLGGDFDILGACHTRISRVG